MLDRTRFAVFVALGLIFLALGWGLAHNLPSSQETFTIPLFINFGTALVGVGLIRFLWDVLGAPSLRSEMERLGVVRFWINRRDGETERRKEYLKFLATSQKIDLMGLNLYTEVFGDAEVRDALERAVRSGKAKVRILISDPRSAITTQRSREPSEINAKVFSGLLEQTLTSLGTYPQLRSGEPCEGLLVRASDRSVIYVMVIRLDDQMFVCNYFSSMVGDDTPGMQLRKLRDYCLFEKYSREFESVWSNSRSFGLAELEECQKLVQPQKGGPQSSQ